MSKFIFKALLSLTAIMFVTSCGTTSSQNIRGNSDASITASSEFDSYVPGCYNVSPKKKVLAFEPYFFHSTKESILREGVVWGPKVVYKVDSDDSNFVRFKKEYSQSLISQFVGADGRTYSAPPFCRVYDAPIDRVNTAIDELTPVLDNPIYKIYGGKEYRYIEFDTFNRENPDVKWQDKYAINSFSTDSGQTVVVILRDLYISRSSEASYIRATSDGHNEIWLLGRIGNAVN